MTKEEILENNKLIAEFMGFTFNYGRFEKIREYEDEFFSKHVGGVSLKEVFYSSDWNWLMPVVEKIEAMDMEVVITKSSTGIYSEDQDNPFESICFNYGRDKLSATYQAVISFIKQVKG